MSQHSYAGTTFPVLDSPSADLQGQIVFVGYGIVDPTQRIDDYADVDVHNCIVLFLRGKPDYYQGSISHADKVQLRAPDRGALAYLTATGPCSTPMKLDAASREGPAPFMGSSSLTEALPGAWISTDSRRRISSPEAVRGPTLPAFAPSKRNLIKPHQHALIKPTIMQLSNWKTTIREGLLTNVVGLLPGTGPDTIVIGAHRDHFGRSAGLWFPGADDNASGTAVVLEVARAIGKTGLRGKRTILFVSFSGEEQGLARVTPLYLERPVVPLSSTKAMINIDHAGMGNGRLTDWCDGI